MKYLFIAFFSLFIAFAQAQKKKEIKKYGIKSVVSTETTGSKTITDSKSYYNSSGLLIEEVNYDKEGQLKSTTRYKYNKEGEVIEEQEFDSKNTLKEKKTVKYNPMGEKVEELTLDGNERQLKKVVYTYDSRGLKTEKKVYDAANNLVSTKKIVYSTK